MFNLPFEFLCKGKLLPGFVIKFKADTTINTNNVIVKTGNTDSNKNIISKDCKKIESKDLDSK